MNESPLHPDMAALAETLADRIAGPLQISMAELARLQAESTNVRSVPAARWAADSLTLPQGVPVQLLGQQLDRRRVTIWLNAGTSCYVAPTQDTARAGTGAALLSSSAGRLVLESTCELWAFATAADSAISWVVEEFDA